MCVEEEGAKERRTPPLNSPAPAPRANGFISCALGPGAADTRRGQRGGGCERGLGGCGAPPPPRLVATQGKAGGTGGTLRR